MSVLNTEYCSVLISGFPTLVRGLHCNKLFWTVLCEESGGKRTGTAHLRLSGSKIISTMNTFSMHFTYSYLNQYILTMGQRG